MAKTKAASKETRKSAKKKETGKGEANAAANRQAASKAAKLDPTLILGASRAKAEKSSLLKDMSLRLTPAST